MRTGTMKNILIDQYLSNKREVILNKLVAALPLCAALAITGCNIDVASLLRGNRGNSSSIPFVPGGSTVVQKNDIRLVLAKDTRFTTFSLFKSNRFDLFNGQETMVEDGGQVEFSFWSGISTEEDGLHLYGRQYVTKKIDIQFQDAGRVPLEQLKEAPEYGWSVVAPDKRGNIKITPGNVKLLRIRMNDDRDQFYAKLIVKDFSQSMVTFDYAIQTATGSRLLN